MLWLKFLTLFFGDVKVKLGTILSFSSSFIFLQDPILTMLIGLGYQK